MTDQNELVGFVENLKLQWMSMIDAIIDPIMTVNKNYEISKTNKAMAALSDSLDVKSVIGKKCYQIFANSNKPCDGCMMRKAFEDGNSYNFELPLDNNKKYFEVTSQPWKNEKGIVEGVVQVYRDRTEAKSLHAQLVQSEKLASIGLLAGGIAHEINNPLGGILIFSQMLLKELDKKSPHYQDVVEIEGATQRCKEIVDRLLEFARQQPGVAPPSSELIRLEDTISTAMRFASVAENAKKCEIFYDWSHKDGETIGDRNKFIQVFLNIFQNAFQAMPKGGVLTITQREQMKDHKHFHIIEIKDTGVGIPPDQIDKIFDPFFTTKEPGEGTGLGLAICYGIITELGGDLSVQSDLGEGTSFFIRVPKYIPNNMQLKSID